MGNTGLHSVKAVQDSVAERSYFLKTHVYQPKRSPDEETLYLNTLYEQLAHVKKIHVQHWALKGVVSSVFKVCCYNKWDVHPINITNIGSVKRNYATLAESDRGPMIAEHRNTLVVQFTIQQKYTESVTILNNFAERMCDAIKVPFLLINPGNRPERSSRPSWTTRPSPSSGSEGPLLCELIPSPASPYRNTRASSATAGGTSRSAEASSWSTITPSAATGCALRADRTKSPSLLAASRSAHVGVRRVVLEPL